MTTGGKMGGYQHLESLYNLHLPPRRRCVFLRNVDDHLLDCKKPYPSRRPYEVLEKLFFKVKEFRNLRVKIL